MFEFQSISHAFRLKKVVDAKDEGSSHGSYDVKNSTTLKNDFYTKQVNTKVKFQNDNFAVEVTGKPVDYNTTDLALNLKHVSKYEPIKQVYETTNGIKFGSPLVGPLRFWTTVSIKYLFFSPKVLLL